MLVPEQLGNQNLVSLETDIVTSFYPDPTSITSQLPVFLEYERIIPLLVVSSASSHFNDNSVL